MSDELLVSLCLRNDQRCQKALHDKFKSELFMLCLRYAKNWVEAEDYLQDGLIQVS